MDIGIALPHVGPHASTKAIAQVAQEAERADFGGLWVLERLLRPTFPIAQYGGMSVMPEVYGTAFEPIETLTYVAAKTSRIKLGTSVIDALFHVPVVLAKRLATLDQFSGGRVIAGFGQGSNEPEFQTANVPMSRRGPGFEELIAAVRAVWGPDPVSFTGRNYTIPESEIKPKPVQTGGIPIIVGAIAPAAIERAARIADGLNPVLFAWEPLEQSIGLFRNAATAAGRDAAKLQIVIRANAAPGLNTGMPLTGSVDQIKDDFARLKALGVNHVFFDMNFMGTPPDQQIKWLEPLQKALG